MNYDDALKAAGAKIICYNHFGSYQGDWLAKVEIEGKTGWIHSYYGSCSGCDALESEFGFVGHSCSGKDYYNPFYDDEGFREGCQTCQKIKADFVSFGKSYLDELMTQEEIEEQVSENIDWDLDADYMLKYVKENAIPTPPKTNNTQPKTKHFGTT